MKETTQSEPQWPEFLLAAKDVRSRASALGRAYGREQVLQRLQAYRRLGVSRMKALWVVGKEFGVGETTIRRWERAAAEGGFVGLIDRRPGRSGRRPSRQRAGEEPEEGALPGEQATDLAARRRCRTSSGPRDSMPPGRSCLAAVNFSLN